MVVTQQRFYVTGGTLPTDAPSYVTRRADTELLEALRRGEFCYVLDTRQMGKSPLMVRVARRLKQEGFTVAVLDLTAIGQNVTLEQSRPRTRRRRRRTACRVFCPCVSTSPRRFPSGVRCLAS